MSLDVRLEPSPGRRVSLQGARYGWGLGIGERPPGTWNFTASPGQPESRPISVTPQRERSMTPVSRVFVSGPVSVTLDSRWQPALRRSRVACQVACDIRREHGHVPGKDRRLRRACPCLDRGRPFVGRDERLPASTCDPRDLMYPAAVRIVRLHSPGACGRRHDTKKGNRPSFSDAAAPQVAEALYERCVARLGRDPPRRRVNPRSSI